MALPFLDDLISRLPGNQVISSLTYTPYDELVVLDLKSGQYESRYHTDGKFFTPVNGGVFQSLLDYVFSNLIHPDDAEAYRIFMNVSDMRSRLSVSNPVGILTGRFRFLTLSNEWRLMESLLISGPEFGLSDNIVYNYLFDVEEFRLREQGMYMDLALPAQHLLSQMPEQITESSFFTMVQERLSRSLVGRWCLIAIDIKHYKLFKELNGQEKGEKLLIRFAEILHQAAQETDGLSCYRGQDDYALLFPFDKFRIDRLFSDLCRAIDALTGASGFFPTFGIAAIDEDSGATVLDLFNRAALTAEEIKDDLQFHMRVYDPKTHERHVEEFRLISEFQNAMQTGEISFYLQPQCRVSGGKIIGAESLARWRRQDGTFISPAFFIPVLEKYGIVTDLDQFIWESVCSWLRGIIGRGLKPVPISVNVSRIDMFSMNVADHLSSLLEKYGLPVSLLKVEITESAYVDDSEQVKKTISDLRTKGFQVLMDDFGSGYSSLNMLRSTKMDVIKLDAQFLHFNAGEEQKGINILESVINMTKSLSTPIIVEGVDTPELVRYLSDLGCRYMQGFYFYRPMPGEQFARLLENPDRIDYTGIRQPIHEQVHLQEFLEGSIHSDAMLNNILGPVVFYRQTGRDVDIIRFNQQFFRLLELEPEQLEARRRHIQEFFYPDDLDGFFRMLENAKQNRITGDSGSFRIYKPAGGLFWIQLSVYYLRDENGSSVFYGSARDITEMLYVNRDLPGGYCRCSTDGQLTLLYISQGFLHMFGYTEDEIRILYNNKLLPMIHPGDRENVLRESDELARGLRFQLSPYRIRHKDGSDRYVADQSSFTDNFGEPCFQSVLVDITQVMKLRNKMSILEKYSTECIIFLRDTEDPATAECVVYGLQNLLKTDRDTFMKYFTEKKIPIVNASGEKLSELISLHPEEPELINGLYTLCLPGGVEHRMHVRFSPVSGSDQELSCIFTLTPATM